MSRRAWQQWELDHLARTYAHRAAADIARDLSRSTSSVLNKAFRMGLHKVAEFQRENVLRVQPWRGNAALLSEDERRVLRERYPHEPTRTLAADMGRTTKNVHQLAVRYGLKKSAAYLRQAIKAEPPQNAGTDPESGSAQRRYYQRCPIGSVRWQSKGYQVIKVAATGRNSDWVPLQVHIWEQHHGPLPEGHVVHFRNGDRADTSIDNLEAISKAELFPRYSIHLLPEDVRSTLYLVSRVKCAIKRKEKTLEEQD